MTCDSSDLKLNNFPPPCSCSSLRLLTVLAVVLCSWLGVTLVMEVHRPLL